MKVIEGKEYLDIKEFAKAANVSQQAIYKKLKTLNSFKLRSAKFNNKTFIEKTAVEDFFFPKDSTNSCTKVNNDEQPSTTEESDRIDKLIEMLQQELEKKDQQIQELNDNLTEALKAIDQQQRLAALDKQKILELETSNQELEESVEAAKAEESHKKGFWSFFRK